MTMYVFLESLFNALRLFFLVNPDVLDITLLTLRVSGTAVLLGSIAGIPTGAYLGLREWRGKKTTIRIVNLILRSIINTFMGLPPVVVGLVVFLLLRYEGPLGFLGLVFTPTAMIITQLILVIPITIGVTISAVGGVDKAIREKALSLGATNREAAFAVLKEAKIGLLTAVIVAFGAAISEVGGIMIAGGNIWLKTSTLTTEIVDAVQVGEYELALTLGVILLAIAFAINIILTILQIREAKH
ncbi:MAG: ABC transporter permease [Candidatus Bathyarchaeia archaeon]|nr:ABC transporter permease [Candidatus Bathyarchaeota archaeon A05DMB-4]MDH7594597.1 ABC transporter permease [Candidatus Bathyarchaeota archaeon]